jgi:predicted deacylase
MFRCGVRNALVHHGVLDGELQAERHSDRAFLELRGTAAYVYAMSKEILETFHPVGAKVSAGEPSGQIHRDWERGHAPNAISYNCHGTLLARGQPGPVKPGNRCFVVASRV